MSSCERRPRAAVRAAACAALLLAGTASACPFCDGDAEAGNPARDTIFGADFWPNLLTLTALPAAFLAAAAAVYHGPPGRRGGEP